MEPNISFFSLPFVDAGSSNDLQVQGLLGADDVLAQFLAADEPLEEPDLNGPTTLHCEICRKKFDNAKKYYGHLRVHSKDNLWICDKCPNQKFSTKQQLMKHSLTHKPLQQVWRCPQCTMSFEALFRLQQHLFAKHLQYRPHKCDKCEKAFNKLSDLKKHKDVHEPNLKRHLCSVCSFGFKDKSNLKRHMLQHTNERCYSCLGCGSQYKQIASLRRHTDKCPLYKETMPDKTARRNYCRVCGMTFQYKSALLEHCVRQHTVHSNTIEKEKEDNSIAHQIIMDTNRTEDNIVDDILSAEDDYLTMATHTEIQNLNFNPPTAAPLVDPTIDMNSAENLMQIEFLKEMNQLHNLDDEMFYNDIIDFDSFQPNQIFNMNTNDMDYNLDRHPEIFFDTEIPNRTEDFTANNPLYHVKVEQMPNELFTQPTESMFNEKPPELPVTVDDCATIFESDVDLEASVNLAANLNQLIGENNVQYISTEDDDTFIISLNSEIDAAQLTDMLNIGAELEETCNTKNIKVEPPTQEVVLSNIIPVISHNISNNVGNSGKTMNLEKVVEVKQEPTIHKKEDDKKKAKNEKVKKPIVFVCQTCNKVFNKKCNYKSHLATVHDPSRREHACAECGLRFGYRSTLNKHQRRAHRPAPAPAHACALCPRRYTARWLLRDHVERDHKKLRKFKCTKAGCEMTFFKKYDFEVHVRYHTGERPHACARCGRRFQHVAHRNRHERTVHRRDKVEKPKKTKTTQAEPTEVTAPAKSVELCVNLIYVTQ